MDLEKVLTEIGLKYFVHEVQRPNDKFNGLCAVIRTKLDFEFSDENKPKDQDESTSPVDYNIQCNEWIQRFSKFSSSNWISRDTKPNPTRFLFKKIFVCQHNSHNKAGSSSSRPLVKSNLRLRDRACKANITIKIKKDTYDTRKNDPYIGQGLPTEIQLNFVHSHRPESGHSLSYLRVDLETKELFLDYFNKGMTPAIAREFHEVKLQSSVDQVDVVNTLANAQINPTSRQIIRMFDVWREQNLGNRDQKSVVELLKNKKEVYAECGVDVVVKENPLVVVVLTPIMKRAHHLRFAGDIVFVDSSGSCDQTKSTVTFLFGATKSGGIPLGVVIHTAQTQENYTIAFQAVKEAIGPTAFGGKGQPDVIMTDDSAPERAALKTTFPRSVLILCIFHICQAVWKWLWDGNHAVQKNDRRHLMQLFRNVLYSKTESCCTEKYNVLLSDVTAKKYANFLAYIDALWKRKKEWALCFRYGINTRGNNTNNYVEASIRIFKDIVLQRCRAFNACALVDFIVTVLERYHQRRLVEFSTRRKMKPELQYAQFVSKAKDLCIIHVESSVYQVRSASDPAITYEIFSDTELCTCPAGQGGAYCKHLCALELQHGKTIRSCPSLTSQDCETLARLAFGDACPSSSFFESMDDVEKVTEPNLASGVDPTNHSSNNYCQEEQIDLAQEGSDDPNKEDFSNEILKLRSNYSRLCDMAEANFSPSLCAIITKLNAELEKIKTPCQLESLNATTVSSARYGKNIGVHHHHHHRQ